MCTLERHIWLLVTVIVRACLRMVMPSTVYPVFVQYIPFPLARSLTDDGKKTLGYPFADA